MSEALSAVNGTIEPGWFTPERMEALGDVLADMASQIVGDLANFAISRRAPGGVFGQETTDAILNDQIANLTRSAIEYLRTRPDERPMLEQLMEQAGVEYDAIDPELFLYRGAEGYFEYELTFLRHIQQQLTLRAAAEGRSTIPNVWLSGQIFELERALADLRRLAELDLSLEDESSDGQQAQIVRDLIGSECGGAGEINPQAVFSVDLTIDGFEDLVVDASGITCGPGSDFFQPMTCGAQVCNSYFYVNRNSEYALVQEVSGIIEEITSNVPPNVVLYLHGGERLRVSWNGQQFSDF